MTRIIYSVILGLLIICIIFSILQIKFMEKHIWIYKHTTNILLFYVFAKIITGLIMLINIQKAYIKDWNNETCTNLKPLTLFWLILNYIMVGLLTFHIIYCFISTLMGSDKDL